MRPGSKTLERGLQALNALANSPDECGPRELARRLSITRSAAQRILNTLTAFGFAQQNTSSRLYRLGYAVRNLAATIETNDELLAAAREPMNRLSEAAGETVCLHVRDGSWRVSVMQIGCDNELRYNVKVGVRYPLNAGAAGRVLLAYLPLDDARELGKRLEWKQWTNETARNWKEFERWMVETKRVGFAISRGESTPGVCGIAAPIFDISGSVVAAIGLHAPKVRMPAARIAELAPRVVRAAAEAAQTLGYRSAKLLEPDRKGQRRVKGAAAKIAAGRQTFASGVLP
jgi:IclR family acetate operon transcriptional repressor